MKKYTPEIVLDNARKVHGDKYDYSLMEYVNTDVKIKIICPIHGVFEQTPYVHINCAANCPKCADVARKVQPHKLNTETFIEKANLRHNNKYDYSKVNYINTDTKVTIICPEHGEFQQTPNAHLNGISYNQGNGCPKCSNNMSFPESEICKFLELLNVDYEQSNRTIISPKELDIYIPDKNIAIEYDGLLWHSYGTTFPNNVDEININQHLDKTLVCESKDIQLLHIFEHEWRTFKPFIQNLIRMLTYADLEFSEDLFGYIKYQIDTGLARFSDDKLILNRRFNSVKYFDNFEITEPNEFKTDGRDINVGDRLIYDCGNIIITKDQYYDLQL